MVTFAQVRQSNAQLDESTVPRTSLFVGGTSGLGKLTLIELVSLGLPVKAYVVGRKTSEPAMRPVLEDLRRRNPKAEIVWVEAEISLLSEVRRVCDIVKEKESRLDFLCLSAGYAPFAGRNNTAEGIDVTHSLEYYGRMLSTLLLLPLLRASPSPRVLTILGAVRLSAKGIDADDLNLEKPGKFGGLATQAHMSAMNTLFLDRLSSDPDNQKITFVHNWPGLVDTGNAVRHHTPSFFSPVPITILLKPVFWVLGYGEQEAGERHVFVGTSGVFGGLGPKGEDGAVREGTRGDIGRGLFLVDHRCEVIDKGKVLEELRGYVQGKVWGKTMEVLGPFL
ncbi:short chain dehydrogenase reductase family protein [Colletotrichum plurivorum]|uniref:Short chain dehydrogenase reductase family protein n=1 Tax=Colletotrichum plurivorum TaxID=2175906 RepID=A0A8H6KAM1_9PEZI|nr:short chain dehydrogenase reductase family protein [Colletotrichum plurivorum]